jgi:hypothetical protein
MRRVQLLVVAIAGPMVAAAAAIALLTQPLATHQHIQAWFLLIGGLTVGLLAGRALRG